MTNPVINDNNKIQGLIFVLVLFNVMDGMLTIAWIGAGVATEANPLMALLLGIHPVLFMITKILLVGLGAMLLWRFRDRALAVGSLYLCLATYSLLILYHGGWMMV